MGKLKGYVQDWLDEYGFRMGFGWENHPSTLEEMQIVRRKHQDAKEYYDNKKEK